MKIIIVGGGIAGLATAIALRSPGRSIIVLERSSLSREVGALISLQPNASKIVSSWKIDRFFQPCEPMVDEAFRIFDVAGNLVRDIRLDTADFGADRILYHRQDLHAALKTAVTSDELPGEPAVIRCSSPVTSCDPIRGVVTIGEDGVTEQADVIIGADGIHSVIRDAVADVGTKAIPTGISAYRALLSADCLSGVSIPSNIFDVAKPVTTMVVGHDRRVIMGPARGGKVLGIVGLVPDELMQETSSTESWVAGCSSDAFLKAFEDFPDWLRAIFKKAEDLALWQLRDIDPLPQWVKGRTILIGDAAHAMLPTQGQGASQSFEDAEALQAFFSDFAADMSGEQVEQTLQRVFKVRHERASLIQKYSRQQAKPGADHGPNKVTLDPIEFIKYNCSYSGARDWEAKMQDAK